MLRLLEKSGGYANKLARPRLPLLSLTLLPSLVMELRDDSKTTYDEAIELSTYSNSKAGVLSYVAIFDNLWEQTELYEQLKITNERLATAIEQLKVHDKIQKEFIDIAAHELRTPIQPILGLSDLLLHSTQSEKKQREMIDVIVRNAKRLQRLTEDILDVTKIESKSLGLKKELFNLSEMLRNSITDSNQIIKEHKDSSLILQLIDSKDAIFIEADKGRINQVISNLLSNAIKFTNEGSISITIRKSNEVVVSVKDSGSGLDPEILPRLFSKFATKSDTGTGLGLFISKSIIEAHDGMIWAENNKDGSGATFSFSLPITE